MASESGQGLCPDSASTSADQYAESELTRVTVNRLHRLFTVAPKVGPISGKLSQGVGGSQSRSGNIATNTCDVKAHNVKKTTTILLTSADPCFAGQPWRTTHSHEAQARSHTVWHQTHHTLNLL